MRGMDFLIFYIILNAVAGAVNSLPIYYDSTGTAHNLYAGIPYSPDPNIQNNNMMNNMGCAPLANGSYNCNKPSALSAPNLVSSFSVFLFGFWPFLLDYIFPLLAFGGGIIYSMLIVVGIYAPLAAVVSFGTNISIIILVLTIISGRYVES